MSCKEEKKHTIVEPNSRMRLFASTCIILGILAVVLGVPAMSEVMILAGFAQISFGILLLAIRQPIVKCSRCQCDHQYPQATKTDVAEDDYDDRSRPIYKSRGRIRP
jgi:hypothetical protein